MSLGLRHASRRRKIRQSGFPTRNSMLKTALDVIIFPVAFLSPFALLPQVMQVYATRDVSSLSFWSWLAMGFFNIIWIYYALVHKEKPILVTNLMYATLNFSVVLAIILFR